MIRHFGLFILVTFVYLNGPSQLSKTDSLLSIIRKGRNDTNLVNSLNSLAKIMSRHDPDTSVLLSEKACRLSVSLNWKIGEGKSYEHLGNYYFLLGDFPKALENYSKSLDVWEKLESESSEHQTFFSLQKASALANTGVVYRQLGEYQKSLDYYSRALEIYQRHNDKLGVARQLGNFGIVYMNQSNYPKALEYYLKALKVFEEIGNKSFISLSLANIGNIYNFEGHNQTALAYYFRSLKLAEEIDNPVFQSQNLGNIGLVYTNMKEFDKAIDFLNRAQKVNEAVGNKQGVANNIGNIGLVYLERAVFCKPEEAEHCVRLALKHFSEALKLSGDLGDQVSAAVWTGNIGSAHLKLKNLKEAGFYLNRSLVMSGELGDVEGLSTAYQNLYRFDSLSGNHQKAFEHYKLYIAMRDSLNNEDNVKKQTRLEMQFEFDKKQTADSVKVAEEKKVAAAELRTEKNKKYSLYGGLLLVLIFAAFIFNRFKITQKQKSIIEQQKVVVEEQKQLVEEKNKDILDSIYYAQRIQRSLMPSDKYFSRHLRK